MEMLGRAFPECTVSVLVAAAVLAVAIGTSDNCVFNMCYYAATNIAENLVMFASIDQELSFDWRLT